MDQPIKKAKVYSCRFLFVFLRSECTVHVLNAGVEFAANKGENSHGIRILRTWVAIKEAV